MELKELIDICINKKRIVSLVGAGGKTSLMYLIAGEAARSGKKVLVSTTTHIKRPEKRYATGIDEVRALWNRGDYAIAGSIDNENEEKITFLPDDIYEAIKNEAELILLEADGARCFPSKVPAEYEPVIVPETDLVIGIMGMSAIGYKLTDCCFRFKTEGEWLGLNGDVVLDENTAAVILSSEKGTRKLVGNREYIAVLNQCDNEDILLRARKIEDILFRKCGVRSVLCSIKNYWRDNERNI